MRIALFTAVICLSVICTQCSPIQQKESATPETASKSAISEQEKQEVHSPVFVTPTSEPKEADNEDHSLNTKAKETGRQSSSDDDDDDDDDELDLGVDDDDDDDDDDSPSSDDGDDDDEDEDYFESFFDDILGEDDDDDDDDDAAAPASSAVNQPVDPVQETPLQEAEDEPAPEEGTGETDNPLEEQGEGLAEKDPTETAASSSNSVAQPVVVQPVPADDEDAVEDDDDDDDDDEDDEDDVEGELDDLASTGVDDDDDDDDDEDAEEDDDDDDDDDVTDLDDVIEAKRSRALQSTQTRVPAIYIAKYNRFVDNILGRINRILGKSYDPVRVKLQSVDSTNKSKKKKGTKSTNKKRKTSSKRKKSSKPKSPRPMNKMGDMEVARSTESESREPAFILISKTTTDVRSVAPIRNITLEVRASPSNKKKTKNGSNKSKKGTKNTSSSSNNSKQTAKARATLFGLSTLRRDGDVVVNSISDYTNVRTNFILGPLTLRVEKEFGRGSKRQLKSATATTAEMYGKLNLRIVHGGAATLHSIKVLQPKQVRVDSADNHEKTKEYMWRRSSRIASVVSRKLASAAKSMLKPPPAA